MKRLAVLRHAKSSWDDPGLDDFDRPLNDRGWKAARRIGEEMKRRRMDFDFVLASPAARVRETLHGVCEKFEFECEIQFEPRIYGAGGATLLSLIQGSPESVRAPLLVGHNPGLQQLIVDLTRDEQRRLRSRVAHKYPTAALAIIEVPSSWSAVEPGGAEIIELIVPRDLG